MTTQLKERLTSDLKDAMRAQDRTRLLVIRSLLTAITAREKEGGGPLSDDDVLAVIQKQAKQRRDSIEQYLAGGREDLAAVERDELAWIGHYLPAQLSDEDIRAFVQDLITRTGATTRKDMGRVMGEAMRELRGKADGNRVREAVQGLLAE